MRLTKQGQQLAGCWGFCLLCIILSFILAPDDEGPSGELDYYYTIESCKDGTRSFSSLSWGSSIMAFYRLRPNSSSLVGEACPTTFPTVSESTEIVLERSEGWRGGAQYLPVFLLNSDAYASITFDLVDNRGNIILPLGTASVGKRDPSTWPWANGDAKPSPPSPPSSPFTATDPRPPPPPSPSPPPPALNILCGNSCSYPRDGMCDDGGPGAQYSLCSLGSDCQDCGPRESFSLFGRRLSQESFETALLSAPSIIDSGHHSMNIADPMPQPGARRLLKGGYGGSSSSSSGYSSYGSSRFTSTSSQTRSYGGSRYRYCTSCVSSSTRIYVIPIGYRGCYSCRQRSCGSNRRSCGHYTDQSLGYSHGRYEMEDQTFKAPEEDGLWPLTMRITSANVYVESTSSVAQTSVPIYFSFYTEEAEAPFNISWLPAVIGWIGFVVVPIVALFVVKMENVFEPSEPPKWNPPGNQQARPVLPAATPMASMPMHGQTTSVAPMAVAQAVPMAVAYPQAAYPQAAYPQAAYPQAAYPQAAYPQAALQQAVAYPDKNV